MSLATRFRRYALNPRRLISYTSQKIGSPFYYYLALSSTKKLKLNIENCVILLSYSVYL